MADLKKLHEELYPVGTRVVLNHVNDPYTRLRPGTVGTVRLIDDLGTVHVAWDDGSNLGICFEAGDSIGRV